MSEVRWQSGDPVVQRAVDAWLVGRGAPGCEVIAENARRRVSRATDEDGGVWLVKQFLRGAGRKRLRDSLKRWLGQGQANREWHALQALGAAGGPVPAAAAHGRGTAGEAIVVTEYLPSRPLLEALDVPRGERRRLLRALGRRVAELHAAGWVHGDLHFGNVLVRDGEPWLIDVQRARRSERFRDRARDLGILDSSLEPVLSTADRTRLLDASFAKLAPPLAEEAARAAVRDASRAWSIRHARSRARRSLRPGSAAARVRLGALRGLRSSGLPEATLRDLLLMHERALQSGGSDVLDPGPDRVVTRVCVGSESYVIKEIHCRGTLRCSWDRLAGSAARRAWAAAHGLAALGIPCPTPFAYVGERSAASTSRSLFVMQDLSAGVGADEPSDLSAETRARSLLRLLLTLHRNGVHHRDLKGGNIRLMPSPDTPATPCAALLDLEDVRFLRRLDDGRRLRGLVQLNASIGDDLVSTGARLRAFDDYIRQLPFERLGDGALKQIVAESRARRHRWTGSDCAG